MMMGMDDDILVEVKGVSKKFSRSLRQSMWYGLGDLGRALFGIRGNRSKLRRGEFWAVKDVSFRLRRGECLGLIGRNGAGKSTLLKMLNGLIRPDEGSITMYGKIGALIELGAGFNPLLTGRENIYVNAQLLGFTSKEINEKLQTILDFADIGEFIDSPVQNYSSGMKVRLGFAIAAQMDPDVLLIDEVLAVGDIGFVLKCFNKMDELRSKTAIIFVSHGMPQVSRMCTNICLMSDGNSIYQSQDVAAGITKYYELFKNQMGNFQGSDKVEWKNITLYSNGIVSKTDEIFSMQYGHDLCVQIDLNCRQPVYNPKMNLVFYDKEQRNFAEVLNFEDHIELHEVHDHITFKAIIPNLLFSQGNYSITVGLVEIENGIRKVIFRYQSAIYFHVNGKNHGWAPIQLDPHWEAIPNPAYKQ
jgi:lipopolysaccharide transport system ATP-binding protein